MPDFMLCMQIPKEFHTCAAGDIVCIHVILQAHKPAVFVQAQELVRLCDGEGQVGHALTCQQVRNGSFHYVSHCAAAGIYSVRAQKIQSVYCHHQNSPCN